MSVSTSSLTNASTQSLAEVSTFISATDGLKLHARCYGSRTAPGPAVVCLPGLARTAADFDTLATALAQDSETPRRVIAIDYRGRGLSAYDRNPANYAFHVELADVLAVMTALDAMPAVVIGTSRGGILAMLLAAARPTAIAGAILNDIGPVIDAKGLMRIKGYVGKLPQPKDFTDAADILRRLFDAQFPALTADDWMTNARRTFREHNGRLVPTYDVKLAETLKGVALEKPLPALWNEFDALAGVPLMVIRGALSDLLSPETVEAMRVRRTTLDVLEVADQGHAPLLAEAGTIARIKSFIDAAARDCCRDGNLPVKHGNL
jgi:pimeloyl-ACP methyl ester carboxylesterase